MHITHQLNKQQNEGVFSRHGFDTWGGDQLLWAVFRTKTWSGEGESRAIERRYCWLKMMMMMMIVDICQPRIDSSLRHDRESFHSGIGIWALWFPVQRCSNRLSEHTLRSLSQTLRRMKTFGDTVSSQTHSLSLSLSSKISILLNVWLRLWRVCSDTPSGHIWVGKHKAQIPVPERELSLPRLRGESILSWPGIWTFWIVLDK